MTRKHFEWVADSVAPLVGSPIIIERMADELEAMNPRFNKEKFLLEPENEQLKSKNE